jgi:coenzyme PQQ synthesis protein D (PqqD)
VELIDMALLRLADHAVFDPTDADGVILDTSQGVYFGLNPTATLILQAALRFDTADEVVASVKGQIDATDAMLRAGIDDLTAQLDEHRLVAAQEARSS